MRSRQSLLDAAAELWADAEVDAVKVEQICEHAGVSKGLFYFYFESREHLLVELLRTDLAVVGEVVSAAIAADEPALDVLDAAIAGLSRRIQKRPRHLLARGLAEWHAVAGRHSDLADDDGLTPDLRALAAHGQARGEIAGDWTDAEIAALLAAALLSASREWAASTTRQPSLVRRLTTRVDLVVRGAAAG